MADITRVALLLFLCSVYVTARIINEKAFYCRDPDNGKLHAINSTWPSTSFCGNYSCKLKKIDVSEIEYIPLTKYNVSMNNLTKIEHEGNVEVSTPVSVEKKVESDRTNQSNSHSDLIGEKSSPKEAISDRYLTEAEIKSISDVLHTIKKSDLDTLVEIYKLAQDIFKEMDKQTPENGLESQTEKNEKLEVTNMKSIPNNKPPSYWYEPLNVSPPKAARSVDLEHQGSNAFQGAVSYKSNPKQSYYSGSLIGKDLAKVPYYYPITNFQRMSSYVHQPKYTKSCNQSKEHTLINKLFKRQEHRLIQPSVLLPYPFTYANSFNTSCLRNYVYTPNPWNSYDYYKHKLNYQPYAYINPISNNAGLINSQMNNIQAAEHSSVSREENDILDKLLAKAREAKLPAWQTAPLPDHVLDEVRANIEKSTLLKPFSFRKKVNLEKVGKVIKLNEISRKKRETNDKVYNQTSTVDEEFYESFLETVTCPHDTQIGYFRRGNLSKPYPECCPERIEKPVAVTKQERNLYFDITTEAFQ